MTNMRDHHHHHHQQAPSPSSPMITLSLFISILSLLISSASTTDTPPPYIHTDYFLLDCGSSSNTTSRDGRNWDGDTISKVSPSNLQNASSSATAAEPNPAVTDAVPYMTARIIRSPITYSFPVLSGPKFVRLYFYPATYSSSSTTYSTFNKSTSFFSVTANTYTLLRNFSAFLTVAAASDSKPTIVKEFVINVLENQRRLNITFSPDSPSSYAFVNGIEVVSMPDPLYQTHGGGDLPKFVASNGYITSSFQLDNNTALENIYRLNVGGTDVSVNGDTGMYRMWRQDNDYVYGLSLGLTPYLGLKINYTAKTPPYVAPEIVYTTSRTMGNQGLNLNFNLTWIFPVDSGFKYLLRLHFCEIQQEVTRENQRVFFIYINNQTAEKYADVINWSGGRGFPVFRDYVVNVPDRDGRKRSKQDLWLAMYPNMESKPEFADSILNGLEIFKLSQPDGSLAGSNPDPTMNPSSPEKPVFPGKSKRKGSFPAIAVGGVIGGFVVVLIFVCALVHRRRRSVKNAASGGSKAKTSWVPFLYISKSKGGASKIRTSSSLPSDLCRHFLISEIRSATANFHDNFVIGSGGFGNVYKGYVDNGSTSVAIKRLNPSSNQGVHEFETEIKMLSKLRHLHLVSLIGYSDDDGEMILVYDYMANGTLRDHLYKTKNPPLSWKKRLHICIGAARGLHYLHTGAKRTIIHRDVKSTNILLNDKWVAKLSDFGLSKMGPTDVSHTHVSTMVKGSFGYMDPEYFMRQQLTEKSDVYSFGVVLLEVLCARPAVIQGGIPQEQMSLAEWGQNCYRRGILDQIVDKNLRGQIVPECLKKFGEIANSCILDQGIERPTMGDVLWNLEFALQLQETAERVKGDGVIGLDQMQVANPSTPSGDSTTTNGDDVFSASGGHVSNPKSSDTLLNKSGGEKSGTTSLDQLVGNESVLSEIINPKGR